jgi:hypothetical protein
MSLDFMKEMEKLTSTLEVRADWNAVPEVESELEVIFGESGKKVLLIELSKRYDVAPKDAIKCPSAFHTALYYLLGELGSRFVMDRIYMRLSGSVPVSPRVS